MNPEALDIGYQDVDTTVFCVLTRFRVQSMLDLLRFYILFRRIRNASNRLSGQITSAFLMENLYTCFTLSIWKDRDAVIKFNTVVMEHINAANWCFQRLEKSTSGRLLLWSAQFRLSAVSPHNLRWEGVDVEPFIARRSRAAMTFRSTRAASSQGV
jgi:hypothetical protein